MENRRKESISKNKIKRFSNPAFLLLIIATTIFLSEFVIMISLEYLPLKILSSLDVHQEAVLDAIALTIMISPILYLFAFKPLIIYIDLSRKAEKKKNELIGELNQALSEVKTLQGIIPICSACKKIRDDKGYWEQLESYMEKETQAHFSHGLCPECSDQFYGNEDWYKKRKEKKAQNPKEDLKCDN